MNISKRLFLLLALTCIQLYNVKSEKAFHSETVIFADDDVFLHQVELGQTVYSIAHTYKVSVESIYKLNPGSEKEIKLGATLKIPQISPSFYFHTIEPKETLYSVSKKHQMHGEDIIAANPGLSVQTFMVGKTIRIPTNMVTTPMDAKNENQKTQEINALLTQTAKKTQLKNIKVALLLPFGLKEGTTLDNASANRYVEYYEGFLMALDKVKKMGISVHLQVFDIGTDTIDLASILNQESMKDIDLLIGGQSDKQIKMISGFAKESDIPYVIPFTSKSDEPLSNSSVFQVNTPHSYLNSRVAEVFSQKYKRHNIIFLMTNSSNEKTEYIQAIESKLEQEGIAYQSLVYKNDFQQALTPLLNMNKINVIVPSDDSSELLAKLLGPIDTIVMNNSFIEISLFGYPTWQVYSNTYLENYFKLNVDIYCPFYVDQTSSEYKTFNQDFLKWYEKDLINTFPRFGVLGYDTGLFFLKGINEYGDSFKSNVNKINYQGIQTNFHFGRVNNWGGFVNDNFFIVTYNQDRTITKVLSN